MLKFAPHALAVNIAYFYVNIVPSARTEIGVSQKVMKSFEII